VFRFGLSQIGVPSTWLYTGHKYDAIKVERRMNHWMLLQNI